MSNDIQPYTFASNNAVVTQSRGDRSREWLELFFQTAKAAEVLATTDFVPEAMRGKAAQVAAAMMKGYELDIDPLDALANVYIVRGRVGFYAEFMRRRILESGHEMRIIDANDSRAVVAGRRKGSDEWQKVQFTAAQAKNAKIDLGAYPEDKLVARATSRLCKRVFPDVLSGTAIAEDLMDELASAPAPVRAATERADEDIPEPGTFQRKRQPRPTENGNAAAKQPKHPIVEPEEPPLPGDGDVAAEGEQLPIQGEGGGES